VENTKADCPLNMPSVHEKSAYSCLSILHFCSLWNSDSCEFGSWSL